MRSSVEAEVSRLSAEIVQMNHPSFYEIKKEEKGSYFRTASKTRRWFPPRIFRMSSSL